MDDGSVLAVGIDVHGDRMRVDFTGTACASRQSERDRCNRRSVVLYVLRLLVSRRVPLNEGLLAPVELVLPECMLASMGERSLGLSGRGRRQRRNIAAGRSPAQGARPFSRRPGTMNNTLFGTDDFGYYETLGGGHGAMEEPMVLGRTAT